MSHFLRGAAIVLFFQMAVIVSLSCSSEQPVEGEVLYRQHCASCHGVSGKGDGTVAEFLTPRPTDLTVFSRDRGGEYPASEVMQAVDGTKDGSSPR